MLDLVHLRSFVEIAERGTVAAAADALGYTPPAVSQHIAKLEAELETAIFDRVGGRLIVTVAGTALAPLASEMLDLEARCRAVVAGTPTAREVVIAGFASAIAALVIPRLPSLREHARVEIIEVEDHEALRELALGGADIALVQEYSGEEAARDRRFRYRALMSDRLRLVLPPGRSTRTSLAAVADQPWLLNGDGTRCTAATERVLASAGITPEIAGVIADNTTLLQLVSAGAGVTVVPESVTTSAPVPVTVSSADLGVERTIHAATRDAVADSLADTLAILAG